jgi:hypothetical protein
MIVSRHDRAELQSTPRAALHLSGPLGRRHIAVRQAASRKHLRPLYRPVSPASPSLDPPRARSDPTLRLSRSRSRAPAGIVTSCVCGRCLDGSVAGAAAGVDEATVAASAVPPMRSAVDEMRRRMLSSWDVETQSACLRDPPPIWCPNQQSCRHFWPTHPYSKHLRPDFVWCKQCTAGAHGVAKLECGPTEGLQHERLRLHQGRTARGHRVDG